jgi:hypothetical protein
MYRKLRIDRNVPDLQLDRLANRLTERPDLARCVESLTIGDDNESPGTDDHVPHIYKTIALASICRILSSCKPSELSIYLSGYPISVLDNIQIANVQYFELCTGMEVVLDENAVEAGVNLLARLLPQVRALCVGGSALSMLGAACRTATNASPLLERFETVHCHPFPDIEVFAHDVQDGAEMSPEDATLVETYKSIFRHIGHNLRYIDCSNLFDYVSASDVEYMRLLKLRDLGTFPSITTVVLRIDNKLHGWKTRLVDLQSLPKIEALIVLDQSGPNPITPETFTTLVSVLEDTFLRPVFRPSLKVLNCARLPIQDPDSEKCLGWYTTETASDVRRLQAMCQYKEVDLILE